MENARNDTTIGIVVTAYLLIRTMVTLIILIYSTKVAAMKETTSKSPDDMTWKQVSAWIIGTLILMGGAVYAAYKTTEHHHPQKDRQHEESLKTAEPIYSPPARSTGKGKGLLHGLHVSLPELPGLPRIKIAYHVRVV